MKLISWNVNGIRAVIRNGFLDFLKQEKPDILALQEIKIDDDRRAAENFDFVDYIEYWHPAERPGYSGTAILINKKLEAESKNYLKGFEDYKETEGRVQALEFENFFLINAYFPNANHELSRLDFKIDFNRRMLKFIKELETKKPVIICGDFNVAHQPIDLARPKENEGNAGYTAEERAGMDDFLSSGLIDTFRFHHPDTVKYSWWSYRFRARAKNLGWRIDYFLISPALLKKVKKAEILDNVFGSDHCPVLLELK